MKLQRLTTTISSILLASAFFALPASALEASQSSSLSVRIRDDGIVRVVGAEITSISGNVVNAVSHLKNTVINWAFITNASTTIATSPTSSTSSPQTLRVGDKVAVSGVLTSIGTTLHVQASKILDTTLLGSVTTKVGTVQSVNAAQGSFTVKTGDKVLTVLTNTSTVFGFQKATSTTPTLSSLVVGEQVMVSGAMSTDGTTLTAARVRLFAHVGEWKKNTNAKKDDDKKSDNDKGGRFHFKQGFGFGLH
ncbi:MAG: hypothetical protein RIQ41_421 [Candidatus Parcubacteria bacterium]|jgi:hypothetical protein